MGTSLDADGAGQMLGGSRQLVSAFTHLPAQARALSTQFTSIQTNQGASCFRNFDMIAISGVGGTSDSMNA